MCICPVRSVFTRSPVGGQGPKASSSWQQRLLLDKQADLSLKLTQSIFYKFCYSLAPMNEDLILFSWKISQNLIDFSSPWHVVICDLINELPKKIKESERNSNACRELSQYFNCPKFLDISAWTNSVDSDETAPAPVDCRSSLIRVFTVCHSFGCITSLVVQPQLKF